MITKDLIESYSNATYTVFQTDIQLKVGEVNSDLDVALKKNYSLEWAYISAANPGLKQLRPGLNQARHTMLLDKVRKSGYTYLEGESVSSANEWPPERSILVFDITREEAEKLGKHFEQNVILFGRKGKQVELVFLNEVEASAMETIAK